MQDSNEPEDKKDRDAAESNSEATSKKLLSDVEDAEKDTSSSSSQRDPGPSPDGAFDESNERKDAGPM